MEMCEKKFNKKQFPSHKRPFVVAVYIIGCKESRLGDAERGKYIKGSSVNIIIHSMLLHNDCLPL